MKEIVINKAFKTEIYSNNIVKNICNQFFGNRRFVYNKTLSIIEKILDKNYPIKHYTNTKTDDKTGVIKQQNISLNNKKNFQFIGTMINEEYKFLSNSHSQSNQEAIHSLHKAWSNYLNPEMKNFGKPKFKKRKYSNTFYLPNQNNISINEDNSIYIKPLDKFIKKELKDKKLLNSYNKLYLKKNLPKEFSKFDCKITGITISKDMNKMFISINYKFSKKISQINSKQLNEYISHKSKRMIGIDLGLKDKLILSNGTKIKGINSSNKYKKLEEQKKTLQRKISKKIERFKKQILLHKYKKGYSSISKKDYQKLLKSRKKDKYQTKQFDLVKLVQTGKVELLKNNYKFTKEEYNKMYSKNYKIKWLNNKVKRIEKKQYNIKLNENHHISKQLSEDFDFISMENLQMKGMQKLWGNKIKVLGLSQLQQMIKYKTENQGKIFYQIDKWYPSTKTCSCCGNHKKDLTLKNRIYVCDECNISIDRDINASINILYTGLSNYTGEDKELYHTSSVLRDLKNYHSLQFGKISKVVEIKTPLVFVETPTSKSIY